MKRSANPHNSSVPSGYMSMQFQELVGNIKYTGAGGIGEMLEGNAGKDKKGKDRGKVAFDTDVAIFNSLTIGPLVIGTGGKAPCQSKKNQACAKGCSSHSEDWKFRPIFKPLKIVQSAATQHSKPANFIRHEVGISPTYRPGTFTFQNEFQPVKMNANQVCINIKRRAGLSGKALVCVKLVPMDNVAKNSNFNRHKEGKDILDKEMFGESGQIGRHYKQLSEESIRNSTRRVFRKKQPSEKLQYWNEEAQTLEIAFAADQRQVELKIDLIQPSGAEDRPDKNVTFVAQIVHVEPAGAKIGTNQTCAIIKCTNYKDVKEKVLKYRAQNQIEDWQYKSWYSLNLVHYSVHQYFLLFTISNRLICLMQAIVLARPR